MGLGNTGCTKRGKNKAGKGPGRAGWGGDLQEAAPTMGAWLREASSPACLVQVLLRPGPAQRDAGRAGALGMEVLRGGDAVPADSCGSDCSAWFEMS